MSERWVFGGVAAELATRLHASAAFIRALLLAALFIETTGTMVAGRGSSPAAATPPCCSRRRCSPRVA